jgi:hypothetical protein
MATTSSATPSQATAKRRDPNPDPNSDPDPDPNPFPNDVFRRSVAGHREAPLPSRGPWSPPNGLRPHTFEPIGVYNGWHIDDGHGATAHGQRVTPDFSLDSYLATPWLVIVVLLTDVQPDGGPTVLCAASHQLLGRLLAVAPRCLHTARVYSSLVGITQWYEAQPLLFCLVSH